MALGEAEIEEAVVEVVSVGVEELSGARAEEASVEAEEGVDEGHGEYDHRNGERDDGDAFLSCEEGGGAEYEAEEECAGVAHEDGCGVEVVA